jgi:osmoprotectant transport system ATP-binding protein
LLELAQAAKRFAGVTALQPTSLEIEAGRTLVLIGPSGCGKTTALRLMLGLTAPDSGSVRFRGAELDARALAVERRRMGYVVQNGGLFPHLTGLGNVTLMARYLGWAAHAIEARVRELSELVRLPLPSLARYPAELSGGQQQRVALMRALMLDPELLFLDEPLGALDPLVRFELQDDLRAVFARPAQTVVLVTHDLAEAALFAHVVVLMKDGQVVQRGSLEDLLERPADPFVTRFVRAQRRWTLNEAPEPTA